MAYGEVYIMSLNLPMNSLGSTMPIRYLSADSFDLAIPSGTEMWKDPSDRRQEKVWIESGYDKDILSLKNLVDKL